MKNLKEILEKHVKWLTGEEGGERADLYEAHLAGAHLIGANLTRANLIGAHLAGAHLIGANLTRADLTGANLTGANLTRADLTGANLTRANLTEANLIGALLIGANLTRADLYITCWPLWCGSSKVKVDLPIASQLAAHFCALDCKDPQYIMARDAILPLAKLSRYAVDLRI